NARKWSCQIFWYSHKNRATIRSSGWFSAYPRFIRSHRPVWLPYTLMVIDLTFLRKRTIRDFAAFIHVHCVNTLSDHSWRGSINVRAGLPSVAEIEALGLRAQ